MLAMTVFPDRHNTQVFSAYLRDKEKRLRSNKRAASSTTRCSDATVTTTTTDYSIMKYTLGFQTRARHIYL